MKRWWPFGKRSAGADVFEGAGAPLDVRRSYDAALGLSSVWAAVSRIAGTISTLPVHLMEDTPDGARKATHHPLYRLLRVAPNPAMTPADFVCGMVISMLLRGNGYARIMRGQDGHVSSLWLLHPDHVRQEVVDGWLHYRVGSVLHHPDTIWHAKGLTIDGFTGLSVIEHQAVVLNHGLQSQAAGERIARNVAVPSGIIKTPPRASPEDIKETREKWQKAHSGNRVGTVAALPDGWDYKPFEIKASDAEFIKARQMNREDVAALFQLPVSLMGGAEPTGDAEERGSQFLNYTLLQWISRIEQSFRKDVLLASEQDSFYLKLNHDALLRTSLLKRTQAQMMSIGSGVRSPNEVRAIEDLAPRAGGNVYLEPLNMARVRETAEGAGVLEYSGPKAQEHIVIEEGNNGSQEA